MKIEIAIVESQPKIRFELENLLNFYHIFEIAAVFEDINEANDFLCSNEMDGVFINLSVGNPKFRGDGSYLAYNLARNCPDLIVVAYDKEDHPASELYKMQSAEFFTLPFDVSAIQRVEQRLQYMFDLIQHKKISKNRSLMIKTNLGYQMVNLSDVLFIERYNRKNRMITTEGNYS